jgi:hypothetical protein
MPSEAPVMRTVWIEVSSVSPMRFRAEAYAAVDGHVVLSPEQAHGCDERYDEA